MSGGVTIQVDRDNGRDRAARRLALVTVTRCSDFLTHSWIDLPVEFIGVNQNRMGTAVANGVNLGDEHKGRQCARRAVPPPRS